MAGLIGMDEDGRIVRLCAGAEQEEKEAKGHIKLKANANARAYERMRARDATDSVAYAEVELDVLAEDVGDSHVDDDRSLPTLLLRTLNPRIHKEVEDRRRVKVQRHREQARGEEVSVPVLVFRNPEVRVQLPLIVKVPVAGEPDVAGCRGRLKTCRTDGREDAPDEPQRRALRALRVHEVILCAGRNRLVAGGADAERVGVAEGRTLDTKLPIRIHAESEQSRDEDEPGMPAIVELLLIAGFDLVVTAHHRASVGNSRPVRIDKVVIVGERARRKRACERNPECFPHSISPPSSR